MRGTKSTLWTGVVIAVLLAATACGTPEPPALPTANPSPTPTIQPPPPPTATAAAAPEQETEEGRASSPLPTPASEVVSPLETPATPEEDTTTPATAAGWMADGIVTDGEYTDQADFGDMRLWWLSDENHLYIAMEGDTDGWVAVGINPERGMQGADYLFGYIEDGEPKLWDAYGTAPTGANHPPDEDLGGTNDIITFAGIEENGITRFEIQIPLNSGDAYDQALEPGQGYPLIIAIGGSDDYNAYHLRYARGELLLAPRP